MNRKISAVIVIVVLATIILATYTQLPKDEIVPIILGFDHIPLAVGDIEIAGAQFEQLGFTLKPGRYHENGIQNKHIKFKDGTEIEIISAEKNRDALTAEYLLHLQSGDGPAFVGLYVSDLEMLAGWFEKGNVEYLREGELLTFPKNSRLRYLFFGTRLTSPTDQPEHFVHKNDADGLISVWIAGDDFDMEEQLFSTLGAEISEQEVFVPDKIKTRVARFKEANVLLLPGSYQLVPGRRIIGATVRTTDLEKLRDLLGTTSWTNLLEKKTKNWQSIFISPDIAHGLWLEFREYLDD
jgi:hypothetical protein